MQQLPPHVETAVARIRGELGEFHDTHADGRQFPDVLTIEDAGEAFCAYRKRFSNSSRRRVYCDDCGRFGYVNVPDDFDECPECQLLRARCPSGPR